MPRSETIEAPGGHESKQPAPGDTRASRRRFLAGAGVTAALVSLGAALAALGRFFTPNVETPAPGPVEVGSPDAYLLDSLTHVEAANAYLGRDAAGFFAIVAVCTHLGCTPRLEAEGFVCPCHGSHFTRMGAAVAGPAARPLERAFVGRAANGRLYVDRGRRVDVSYRLSL
ncbi:MAG: QcrA and Rieske domain-containing protein [Chloroflexota bacterium]